MKTWVLPSFLKFERFMARRKGTFVRKVKKKLYIYRDFCS